MTKRVYGRGNTRHTEQYNSYVSKTEFEQLEELRKLVARKKGRKPEDFSRGSFLMWMYRKCYTELDEGIPLEDFCDNNISDMEFVIGYMQKMIGKTKVFKEKAMEIIQEEDDGQTEVRQGSEDSIIEKSDGADVGGNVEQIQHTDESNH